MLGSTRENLLPKVHLGCIVLCPGHVRLIVKDKIFLLGPSHGRPLNPRAGFKRQDDQFEKAKFGKNMFIAPACGHSSLNEAGPELDYQLRHFPVGSLQISAGFINRLPPGSETNFATMI